MLHPARTWSRLAPFVQAQRLLLPNASQNPTASSSLRNAVFSSSRITATFPLETRWRTCPLLQTQCQSLASFQTTHCRYIPAIVPNRDCAKTFDAGSNFSFDSLRLAPRCPFLPTALRLCSPGTALNLRLISRDDKWSWLTGRPALQNKGTTPALALPYPPLQTETSV